MAQVPISIKRITVTLLSFVVALSCGLVMFGVWGRKPPKERELIQDFYNHRAAYEHLRHMLLEDEKLLRVANWGIETTNGGPRRIQEGLDFPVSRYNEYLSLLQQAGAKGAFRKRGEHPEVIGIDVWSSGFGGATRHVEVCWLDQPPSEQVASLDEYFRTPKPRRPVFKHIVENWYLFADW